jgi:hypothetical protein
MDIKEVQLKSAAVVGETVRVGRKTDSVIGTVVSIDYRTKRATVQPSEGKAVTAYWANMFRLVIAA